MTKGIKHKDIGGEMTRTEWEADDSHELETGTSFPGSPTEKDRYYRSDEHKWYIYNGTAWKLLGGTDISDANAAVGDVRTGKTFYATAEPKKTGTVAEVAIVAGSETVPAGIHTATTLSAIDGDLAVGNIKKDVNVFGKVGTFSMGVYALGNQVMCGDDFTAQTGGGSIGYPYTMEDTYTKIIEIYSIGAIFNGKTLRIKHSLAQESPTANVYSKIYKSGVAVGVEHSTSGSTFQIYTEDIAGWTTGSNVEVWGRRQTTGFVLIGHLQILGANEMGLTRTRHGIREQ